MFWQLGHEAIDNKTWRERIARIIRMIPIPILGLLVICLAALLLWIVGAFVPDEMVLRGFRDNTTTGKEVGLHMIAALLLLMVAALAGAIIFAVGVLIRGCFDDDCGGDM